MSDPQESAADVAERDAAIRKSKEYWWLPPAVAIIVSCVAGVWGLFVLDIVPEPYLDEVFHIRQAQAYCDGKFNVWDPKITTPPGLYLLPLPFVFIGLGDCSVRGLRSENLMLLAGVGFTAFRLLARRSWIRVGKRIIPPGDLFNDAHAAINVCLFPPLFFFSALFYTDIASTFVVLMFVDDLLAEPTKGTRFSFQQLAYAALALLMRQTNIFWVAIMPAAIDVVTIIRSEKVWRTVDEKAGSIYDRRVEDAAFEDYLRLPFSIAYDAIRNLSLVVMAVPQHILLLTAFGAFVAWNEGVVLGDKSNHVATIHLPQMLYIWPYITFFSFPILLPYVFDILRVISTRGFATAKLPGYGLILILTGIAALVVRFNTIVHPFTLADNRHYVFYVFRLLLRNSLIKYGATPVYVLTGWLCIRRLGARASALAPTDTAAGKPATKATASVAEAPKDDSAEDDEETPESTTLPMTFILLLTTALSLVTAPLVEPRYFIIPWVLWRVLLPPTTRAPADAKPTVNRVSGKENGPLATALKQHDPWLWLETLWFLCINGVTGYIFLYRGFGWPSEPGNVQRFMW